MCFACASGVAAGTSLLLCCGAQLRALWQALPWSLCVEGGWAAVMFVFQWSIFKLMQRSCVATRGAFRAVVALGATQKGCSAKQASAQQWCDATVRLGESGKSCRCMCALSFPFCVSFHRTRVLPYRQPRLSRRGRFAKSFTDSPASAEEGALLGGSIQLLSE